MKWYEWNTQQDFDNWQNALCAKLGYPLISVNQASGERDTNAAMTTTYTNSHEVKGKIIADVEDQYAECLIETNLRLPIRTFGDE